MRVRAGEFLKVNWFLFGDSCPRYLDPTSEGSFAYLHLIDGKDGWRFPVHVTFDDAQ